MPVCRKIAATPATITPTIRKLAAETAFLLFCHVSSSKAIAAAARSRTPGCTNAAATLKAASKTAVNVGTHESATLTIASRMPVTIPASQRPVPSVSASGRRIPFSAAQRSRSVFHAAPKPFSSGFRANKTTSSSAASRMGNSSFVFWKCRMIAAAMQVRIPAPSSQSIAEKPLTV